MKIYIIDIDEKRREALCELISNGNYSVKVCESVLKNNAFWYQKNENEIRSELEECLSYDVIILHISASQNSCKEFICEWLIKNDYKSPVILISGDDFSAGTEKGIKPRQFQPATWDSTLPGHPPECIQDRRNYYRFEKALNRINMAGVFHIKDFLSYIEEIKKHHKEISQWNEKDWIMAWQKLTGIDMILETKLELLHSCLAAYVFNNESEKTESENKTQHLYDSLAAEGIDKSILEAGREIRAEIAKNIPLFDNELLKKLTDLRNDLL